jgi:cellulose synthase/poly-beta-1,6-N-acetylglucosamine synthase-like glycosyltransferase
MDTAHEASSALAGRRVVVSVILAILGIALGTTVASMLLRHSGPTITEIVRFLLNVGLCVALYRGANVVRWLTVVLLLVAATMAFVATFRLWPALGSYVLLAYGLVYGACVIALVVPASVKAHFGPQTAPANNALERERGQ